MGAFCILQGLSIDLNTVKTWAENRLGTIFFCFKPHWYGNCFARNETLEEEDKALQNKRKLKNCFQFYK